MQSHFIVKPNLVLRLGWGFDNMKALGKEVAEHLWKVRSASAGGNKQTNVLINKQGNDDSNQNMAWRFLRGFLWVP